MSENILSTSMKKVVKTSKLLTPQTVGFNYCPGCQDPLLARIITDVLEELNLEDKAISVYAVGCSDFILGMMNIDVIFGPHGRGSDMATGAKRVQPDKLVFSVQGDGALMAIGAEGLIGALTRAEKITIIMVNNGVFATTGGQMAPTSLIGQVTTTSPKGRSLELSGFPIHAAELVASFKGTAYSVRTSLSSPANYQRTKKYIKTAFQKQMANAGLSFVEILCPCPPNWHLSAVDCLKYIEEKVIPEFPLGEFKNVDKINE